MKLRATFEDEKMKLFKVREQTQEAIRDYEHKKELVRQADMVLKKGFRIEPEKPRSFFRRPQ